MGGYNIDTNILVAITAGLGGMVLWGLADFFVKKIVSEVNDAIVLFWTQTIGIIPLFLYLLITRDSLTIQFSSQSLITLLILGFFDTGGYLFFYKALEKGKLSIISPLVVSYSAFTVLISALVFGESISLLQSIGLAAVFFGILAVAISGESKKQTAKKMYVRGLPQALIAVLLLSLWFPFWDNFVSQNINHWALLLLGLRVVVSFIMWIYFLTTRNSIFPKTKMSSLSAWGWLIAIAIFDIGAYIAVTWGFRITAYTSIVAMLSAAMSVPSVILGVIFLHEKLIRRQIAGIIMIIGGVVLLAGI